MILDHNFKPKLSKDDFGWHSRQKLPHRDAECSTQFVTFRLADSMPQTLLENWKQELPNDVQIRKRIEAYLDAGHGECLLADPRAAFIVRDALHFHNAKRYTLHAWALMPNHAHILITPLAGHHLPDIMHSIKSYTAQQINKLFGRKGQLWQHESFDRYIRNYRHFAAVVKYIEENPVKAGLCKFAEEWEFGSANKQALPNGE